MGRQPEPVVSRFPEARMGDRIRTRGYRRKKRETRHTSAAGSFTSFGWRRDTLKA